LGRSWVRGLVDRASCVTFPNVSSWPKAADLGDAAKSSAILGLTVIAVWRTKEACLADEHVAESTIAENWSAYSAVDKTQCAATVNPGGPPSYVELLSCIEGLRDACGPDLAWSRPTTWSSYARTCDSRTQTGAAKVKKARISRPSKYPALGASASCRGFPERRVKPRAAVYRRLLLCSKADTNCSVRLLTICILSPDRSTI
jgi:hypothetical protein